jgi:hypothetical protein
MKHLYCATFKYNIILLSIILEYVFYSIHTMNFIKFIKQTFKMLFLFFIHVLLLHLFFADL